MLLTGSTSHRVTNSSTAACGPAVPPSLLCPHLGTGSAGVLQDDRWQATPACLKLYAAGDACSSSSSRRHASIQHTPACCHVALQRCSILHSDAGIAGPAWRCLPNFFCSSSMLAAGAAAARRGCSRGRTRTALAPPATLRAGRISQFRGN
jgi:hypothetical protein